MKEIIAIQCSNCSDIWKYYPVGLEEDIEFLGTPTKCLACGKYYIPSDNAKNMFEEVFDLVRRYKM